MKEKRLKLTKEVIMKLSDDNLKSIIGGSDGCTLPTAITACNTCGNTCDAGCGPTATGCTCNNPCATIICPTINCY